MASSKKNARVVDTWLIDFTRAYDGARFNKAALIFEQHADATLPASMTILGARALLVQQPAVAIKHLLRFKPAPNSSLAAEREMLLGEASARTGDYVAADRYLEKALERARKLKDLSLVSEVGYRYVRRYLFDGKIDVARRYLHVVREGRSKADRLNALHAETHVLSSEVRVREQAQLLVDLLRLIDPYSTEFLHHRAWATHTLAVLARELYLPEALSELERQIAGTWTEDFYPNLFQATKALGWAKALQGDYFNAFRYLRKASDVAPSEAWSVVAACDRAYLARSVKEARWSRQELDVAEELAQRVDWHSTTGEERIGLLLLAELFTPLDSSRSSMYLAKYRELGEFRSRLHHAKDPRLAAFSGYVAAMIEFSLGNKKRALADLRSARSVFERFGYDWRVARCFISEFAVSREEELLSQAAEKLRHYGQSWLADELRASGAQAGDVILPRQQRRVFLEVCQGRSTAQIAKSLDLSEWTISNHLKQIFKAFGVKTRSELVAIALKRGLVNVGSS